MDGKYREDTGDGDARRKRAVSQGYHQIRSFLACTVFFSQSAQTGIGFRRQGCQAVTFDGCGQGRQSRQLSGRQAFFEASVAAAMFHHLERLTDFCFLLLMT